MFLWAHTDTYTVKSDVRRDVHSSAVLSSPVKFTITYDLGNLEDCRRMHTHQHRDSQTLLMQILFCKCDTTFISTFNFVC